MSGEFWFTLERPPRELRVKGRSSIDPDCLVAELANGEPTEKALWIVDDGNAATEKPCSVLGLDGNVKAVRVP